MQKITGKTRTCGLIGNPVEHTLSPAIQNALAEDLQQPLAYVPLLVEKGRLQQAVEGAYALNLLGTNVTVPYKSEVIPYLKEIDSLAEKIGAVNTLVRCEGGYKGYNTDMTGLKRAMETDGIELAKEKVIILGAGGAARAVGFLCGDCGVETVYILNRSIEKAEAIATEVNRAFGRECLIPMQLADYKKLPKENYLVMQCTSVGLAPDTESVVISDDAFYEMVHTGYDLIYKPYETKFMKLVKAHGGKAFNGLKMLTFQAIDAFELWTGAKIDEAESQKILKTIKEEIGINE